MSSTDEEVVALEDQTKAELQDIAEEKGVDWSTSDTKDELIQKIHDADVEAGDVPAEAEIDDEEDGAFDSFPGSVPSEQFPERRPIEVDLADIKNPDKEYEGETLPPLNAESWVVLDGSHDQVDERWDGAIAAVVEYPTAVEHDTDTGITKTFLPPEASLTVRERSQGAMFYLPLDAFKEIHTAGRPDQFA